MMGVEPRTFSVQASLAEREGNPLIGQHVTFGQRGSDVVRHPPGSSHSCPGPVHAPNAPVRRRR